MDTTPLVSIICITYNHEKYISEAIEGFLMQETSFPFEIIIHDDASTDGTANIIRSYEKKFSNLIVPIYQTENQYSKGRRATITSLPLAKGKYIALCEGDDFWTDPLKLQKQVDFLESNPSFSMCFTDAKVVDEEGNYLRQKLNKINKQNLNQELVLSTTTPPTLTLMFIKEYLPVNLPKAFYKAKNGDFYLSALLTYEKDAAYLDICTASYRIHDNGIWSNIDVDKKIRTSINSMSLYLINSPVKNKHASLAHINNLYNDYIYIQLKRKNKYLLLKALFHNILINLRFRKFYFILLCKRVINNYK